MARKNLYNIKAHRTTYHGVTFRSRLEARWAAFFDLVGWEWEYEPIDLVGWSPDFRVVIPCDHSECNGQHVLLAEVKPYFTLKDFEGHPCLDYPYGHKWDEADDKNIPADASAALGGNPSVTHWEMVHGSGGAVEGVHTWIHDPSFYWNEAGKRVQYNPLKAPY